MKRLKLFFAYSLLTGLILLSNTSNATHIVGGVMYAECLGGDNYKVSVTMYRDCFNGVPPFDDFATIGIFNAGGFLLDTVFAPLPGIDTIPIVINNPCLVAPPNVCVERAVYEIVVNLPPIPGGYHLAFQRCCRSILANNVFDPNTQGVTYTVNIADSDVLTCNSTPVFNNPPPTVMCSGFEFTYDMSATDLDGDSLVYSFAAPYIGGSTTNAAPNPPTSPPYTETSWGFGFSDGLQVPSNPQFTLDSVTGFLVGMPTTLGNFVFGVKIEEYRNGIKIGEVRRDFLLITVNCNIQTTASIANAPFICKGLKVDFENSSINSSFFYWDFGDLTTDGDTSLLEMPSYLYADTGIYDVMMVANPGFFCADTAFLSVGVYDSIEVFFPPLDDACLLGNSFPLEAQGTFDIAKATINWDFGPTGNPTNSTIEKPTVSYNSSGKKFITLNIQQHGCSIPYRDSVMIYENPRAIIIPPAECIGLTVDFQENSTDFFNLWWDFGDPTTLEDTSLVSSNTYTYPDSALYSITLITYQIDSLCADTAMLILPVYDSIRANFLALRDTCLAGNTFTLDANGIFSNKVVFKWDFGVNGIPLTSSIEKPAVSFSNSGQQTIALIIKDHGCADTTSSTVQIHANPNAVIIPPPTCNGLAVNFLNGSSNYTGSFWTFGDPLTLADTSLLQHAQYTYPDSGKYDVTLIVSQFDLCYDTVILQVPVYDPLIASFTPEVQCLPGNLFQLNPTGNFNASATIVWNFGVNGTPSSSTVLKPTVSFPTIGFYEVSFVMNNYGCTTDFEDTLAVFPTIAPDFSMVPDTGCQPFVKTFSDNSTAWTALNYRWDFRDGSPIVTDSTPTHIYRDHGLFDLNLVVFSDTGCVDTVTFFKPDFILVDPKPTANFSVFPQEVSLYNPEVEVEDLSGEDFQEINMQDGFVTDSRMFIHEYQDSGSYFVSQVVTNQFNCKDTAVVEVYVKPIFGMYVPNTFTPNGDGDNDIFYPRGEGLTSYKLRIYDRWGSLIFTSTALSKGWDGTLNGKPVQTGVYVWKIELSTVTHISEKRVGHVNLLK